MKRILLSLALTLITGVVVNAQTVPENTPIEQPTTSVTTQTVVEAPSIVAVPVVTSPVIIRTAPRLVVHRVPVVAVRPVFVRPAKRVVVHTHVVRR